VSAQELACGGCGCPDVRLRAVEPGDGFRGYSDVAAVCQGCGSVSHLRAWPQPRVVIEWGDPAQGEKQEGVLTRMAWSNRHHDPGAPSYGDAIVDAIRERTNGALPVSDPGADPAVQGALAALQESLDAAGLAMEQARNLLRQEARTRYGDGDPGRTADAADNLHKQAIRTLTEALAALEPNNQGGTS
jgi:hypothetical protein